MVMALGDFCPSALAWHHPAGPAGLKNSDCLDCHSDKTLAITNAAGKAVSLFVDEAKLKASAHKTNTCVSCHADVTDKHPDDNIQCNPSIAPPATSNKPKATTPASMVWP